MQSPKKLLPSAKQRPRRCAVTCWTASAAAQCLNSTHAQEREAKELAALVTAARATPAGQEKDYSGEMPKVYDPKIVEAGTCVVCAGLNALLGLRRHESVSNVQVRMVGRLRLLQAQGGQH